MSSERSAGTPYLVKYVHASTEFILIGGISSGIIGRAYVESATQSDINITTPAVDDSVPLISEGTEILSVSYTVKLSSSRIRVRTCFNGAFTSAATVVGAMFAGSTCLRASLTTIGASERGIVEMEAEYAPGASGAVTFSVRVGVTGSAFALNSSAASQRVFGGKSLATLVVEEIGG